MWLRVISRLLAALVVALALCLAAYYHVLAGAPGAFGYLFGGILAVGAGLAALTPEPQQSAILLVTTAALAWAAGFSVGGSLWFFFLPIGLIAGLAWVATLQQIQDEPRTQTESALGLSGGPDRYPGAARYQPHPPKLTTKIQSPT